MLNPLKGLFRRSLIHSKLTAKGTHMGAPLRIAHNSLYSISLLFFIILCSACGKLAPLESPAPLENTAGAPIMITSDTYTTDAFQVRYPDGWRVVTSASVNLPSVIFASPDEASLIVISTEPLIELPQPLIINEDDRLHNVMGQAVSANGDMVYLALITPSSQLAEMMTLFAQVTASID